MVKGIKVRSVLCFTVAINLLMMVKVNAQSQLITAESEVRFFSDALLEDIEAVNKEAKGILDVEKKEFVFRVPIKSFIFPKSLMQEHFNENYLESEKFPYGIFKGTYNGTPDFKKDGEYKVDAVGEIDIHGVKQKRIIPAIIKVDNGRIFLKSKFTVKLADHRIEIPTLVFQKIAEAVEVTITSELKELAKQK